MIKPEGWFTVVMLCEYIVAALSLSPRYMAVKEQLKLFGGIKNSLSVSQYIDSVIYCLSTCPAATPLSLVPIPSLAPLVQHMKPFSLVLHCRSCHSFPAFLPLSSFACFCPLVYSHMTCLPWTSHYLLWTSSRLFTLPPACPLLDFSGSVQIKVNCFLTFESHPALKDGSQIKVWLA